MKVRIKENNEYTELRDKEGQVVDTGVQNGVLVVTVKIDGQTYTLRRENCELISSKGLTNL